MAFAMKLLLPSQPNTLTAFDRLRTYLPLFAQKIGNLGAHARFDSLYLEGPLSQVIVGVRHKCLPNRLR
jgi:hypothetical protein